MAYAPPDRDSGRAQRGGLARKARVVSRQPSAVSQYKGARHPCAVASAQPSESHNAGSW